MLMRRLFFGIILASLSVAAMAQVQSAQLYNKYKQALSSAQSLTVSYTIRTIGKSSQTITVELSKPNLARIDRPNETITADGTNIVTYDKTAKTYYKVAQTPKLLQEKLELIDTQIWAPFFFEPGIKPVALKTSGLQNRKGIQVAVLEAKYPEKVGVTMTLYLAVSDSLPRLAEAIVNNTKTKDTTITDVKTLVKGDKVNASKFAFKAPEGSRELSADEINASKWYTNYDEALAAAKRLNKLVLIDFYTDWCHWCKVLREKVFPTEKFKAMSKWFVFCEIDAEQEPSIASKYNVNAYPTSVFVDANGTEVHRLEGYVEADGYVAEMEKAKAAAGKS